MGLKAVVGLTNAPILTGLVKFGGATSGFPALTNSGATLRARLADDSNWAIFQALAFETGTTSGYFSCSTNSLLASPADGRWRMSNNAGSVRADLDCASLLDGKVKTLTESAATGLCDITINASERVSGEVHVSVEADDGADFQTRHLRVPFVAVNKAGTITTTLGTPVEVVAVSAGTLTCTLTLTTGASKITINANAVSSLTQTTLRAKWKVISPVQLTVTAL